MLIDDVLLIAPGERERIHPLLHDLEDAAVYEIADVSRLVEAHVRREDALRWGKDLPNVAPLAPVVWMEFDTAGVMQERQIGPDPVRTFGITLRGYDRRTEPEQVTRFLRMLDHDDDDMVRWVLALAMVWRFDRDGA